MYTSDRRVYTLGPVHHTFTTFRAYPSPHRHPRALHYPIRLCFIPSVFFRPCSISAAHTTLVHPSDFYIRSLFGSSPLSRVYTLSDYAAHTLSDYATHVVGPCIIYTHTAMRYTSYICASSARRVPPSFPALTSTWCRLLHTYTLCNAHTLLSIYRLCMSVMSSMRWDKLRKDRLKRSIARRWPNVCAIGKKCRSEGDSNTRVQSTMPGLRLRVVAGHHLNHSVI